MLLGNNYQEPIITQTQANRSNSTQMLSYMTYRHNSNSSIITMQKKSLAAFPPCQRKTKEPEKKEQEKENQKKKHKGGKREKKKKYNLATTHPSVTGQTPKCKPQERWIGAGDWNHRRLTCFQPEHLSLASVVKWEPAYSSC